MMVVIVVVNIEKRDNCWRTLVIHSIPKMMMNDDNNYDDNDDDGGNSGGEYWETWQLLAYPGDPLHPHHRQHQQDHKSSRSNDPENQTQSKLQALNPDKPDIVDSSVNDAGEAVNLGVAQIKDGFTEADHVPKNIEPENIEPGNIEPENIDLLIKYLQPDITMAHTVRSWWSNDLMKNPSSS